MISALFNAQFFAGKAKVILRELFNSDFCVTALKTAQKLAPFINLTVMGIHKYLHTNFGMSNNHSCVKEKESVTSVSTLCVRRN